MTYVTRLYMSCNSHGEEMSISSSGKEVRWIRNPGREENEGERQSENSCLGPRRLASYYKAIVVGVYVSTDHSESRSISQPLWALALLGPS